MVHSFICSLAGCRIRIETPIDLGATYDGIVRRGFPPLYDLDEAASGEVDGVVRHEDQRYGNEALSVDVESATMTLRCPIERTSGGELLLELAAILLEQRLQQRGAASLVAACADLDGGGVLLLGPSGAGKTSAVIRLCRRGGRLVANDTCLISTADDKLWAIAGTKILGLRRAAVARNEPDLEGLIIWPADFDWSAKVAIDAAQLNICTTLKPSSIGAIYLVHVDDRRDDRRGALKVSQAAKSAVRIALHESLARIVSGSCVVHAGFDPTAFRPYVPSLDSEDLYAKRLAIVDRMVDELGIMSLSGSAADVVDWIMTNQQCRLH